MQIKQLNSPMQCDEAIKCVFDLNKLDLKVYKKLKQEGPIKAQELATLLNRERSTVYRSLQKLSKCGICKRATKTLHQGGYYHEYRCVPIDSVQKKARECLDSWYETIKKTLDSLKE